MEMEMHYSTNQYWGEKPDCYTNVMQNLNAKEKCSKNMNLCNCNLAEYIDKSNLVLERFTKLHARVSLHKTQFLF